MAEYPIRNIRKKKDSLQPNSTLRVVRPILNQPSWVKTMAISKLSWLFSSFFWLLCSPSIGLFFVIIWTLPFSWNTRVEREILIAFSYLGLTLTTGWPHQVHHFAHGGRSKGLAKNYGLEKWLPKKRRRRWSIHFLLVGSRLFHGFRSTSLGAWHFLILLQVGAHDSCQSLVRPKVNFVSSVSSGLTVISAVCACAVFAARKSLKEFLGRC